MGGTSRLMSLEGAQRCRDDDGQRRTDGNMHSHAVIDAKQSHDLVEDGDQNRPTLDTEQTGEDAR